MGDQKEHRRKGKCDKSRKIKIEKLTSFKKRRLDQRSQFQKHRINFGEINRQPSSKAFDQDKR